jgi:hypothetical protein
MARAYSYASTTDVQLHVSVATYTASSRPNLTQVGKFIDDAANTIDSKLAALNFSTPVATGATQAFELLRTWNGVGAAMYAVAALPQGDKGTHLPFLERQWSAILTMLDEGDVSLPGVSTDTTTGLVRSPAYAATGGASPYFTRDYLDI